MKTQFVMERLTTAELLHWSIQKRICLYSWRRGWVVGTFCFFSFHLIELNCLPFTFHCNRSLNWHTSFCHVHQEKQIRNVFSCQKENKQKHKNLNLIYISQKLYKNSIRIGQMNFPTLTLTLGHVRQSVARSLYKLAFVLSSSLEDERIISFHQ